MEETQVPAEEYVAAPEAGVSEEDMLKAVRTLKLVKAYKQGTLTYEQFLKLPSYDLRQTYIRLYGKPLSADQQRGIKRKVAKRVAAKKMALQSKRRNRR